MKVFDLPGPLSPSAFLWAVVVTNLTMSPEFCPLWSFLSGIVREFPLVCFYEEALIPADGPLDSAPFCALVVV